MSYVKLDTGLLQSTLWLDPDACRLFIAALLMARPITTCEPTPTLQTDSLDPGEYTIPAGDYGWVETTGPGLAATACLPWPVAKEAIRRLGQPDQESRTKAHNGRRLLRVDGGYVVLNYARYREKDHSADRTRRWRERRAAAECEAGGDDASVSGLPWPMESPLELAFGIEWHQSNLPPLCCQHVVPEAHARLDWAHVPTKTAFEMDGVTYHGSDGAFEKDRARDRALAALGWQVVRFTGDQLRHNISRCVQEAAAVLVARSEKGGH